MAGIVPFVGDDKFFWASDFPHPDHTLEYLHELSLLLAPLPESSRQKILWKNVSEAYDLGQ